MEHSLRFMRSGAGVQGPAGWSAGCGGEGDDVFGGTGGAAILGGDQPPEVPVLRSQHRPILWLRTG